MAGRVTVRACPEWFSATSSSRVVFECVTLEPGGDIRTWHAADSEAEAVAWWNRPRDNVAKLTRREGVERRGARVGVRRVELTRAAGPAHPVADAAPGAG